MIMIECSRPFQRKASYVKFGVFRRIMWGWIAVTHFSGGINELFEGLGRAGAKLHSEGSLNV